MIFGEWFGLVDKAGLNSRLWMMTGHTGKLSANDRDASITNSQTFFEAWVATISNLYPDMFHGIRCTYILPVGQEKVNFDLQQPTMLLNQFESQGIGRNNDLAKRFKCSRKWWEYFVCDVVDSKWLCDMLYAVAQNQNTPSQSYNELTSAARSFNSVRSSPSKLDTH